MKIREFFETREDGVNLYRTYSDQGFMIRQNETGILYSEAIDVEDTSFTYEETNELIEDIEDYNSSLDPDEISPEEFMALIEEVL